MNKKILFIIFCGVLILLPTVKASAAQVYVGVQIASAVSPTPSGTDNSWCIPVDSQMAILNTNSCSYLNTNDPASSVCSWCPNTCLPDISTGANGAQYVTLNTQVCAGSTIWSGLLTMNNGGSYKVYLYTPNFCSGAYDNMYGGCLQKWIAGKNCNEVCAHYGMSPTGSCYDYFESDCSIMAKIKGSNCSSCNSGSYGYYSASTNACYYNPVVNASCTWSDPNYIRVCDCAGDASTATGFNFNFTASF